MPETFLSMHDWLKRGAEPFVSVVEPQVPPEVIPSPATDDVAGDEIDAAIGDVRRFRAALADTLAMCVDDVLRDIASDVLARELTLAPCDLHAIVVRAVERYGDEPVRIRVHPCEAHELERSGAPVIRDDTLRAGDVVLETRHGSIDASFGVRLERVLARRAL